jgi:hypothetical protein
VPRNADLIRRLQIKLIWYNTYLPICLLQEVGVDLSLKDVYSHVFFNIDLWSKGKSTSITTFFAYFEYYPPQTDRNRFHWQQFRHQRFYHPNITFYHHVPAVQV